MTRRPTTLRAARGKRDLWPHVVDHRVRIVGTIGGDPVDYRCPVPEDMRPVCTKCRGRIDDDQTRTQLFDRPGYFMHIECPKRCPHCGSGMKNNLEWRAFICHACFGGVGHSGTVHGQGVFADLVKPPKVPAVNQWTKGPEVPQALFDAYSKVMDAVLSPAPPVDEELERERARLVGKRARYRDNEKMYGSGLVSEVSRTPWLGADVVMAKYTDGGIDLARSLDPIPDERPRECTFGDLRAGEWFEGVHIGLIPLGAGVVVENDPNESEPPRKCGMAKFPNTTTVKCAQWIPNDWRVTRIDPPKGAG